MELQTPWSSLLANQSDSCEYHEHALLIRHVYQDAERDKIRMQSTAHIIVHMRRTNEYTNK